jgi:hypothetical protein
VPAAAAVVAAAAAAVVAYSCGAVRNEQAAREQLIEQHTEGKDVHLLSWPAVREAKDAMAGQRTVSGSRMVRATLHCHSPSC